MAEYNSPREERVPSAGCFVFGGCWSVLALKKEKREAAQYRTARSWLKKLRFFRETTGRMV